MIELAKSNTSVNNQTYNVNNTSSKITLSNSNNQTYNAQQYEVIDYSQYSDPVELASIDDILNDPELAKRNAELTVRRNEIKKQKEELVEWYKNVGFPEDQALAIIEKINSVDGALEENQFDAVLAYLEQFQNYKARYVKTNELLNDPNKDCTKSINIMYGQLNTYNEYLSDNIKQQMQAYIDEYVRIIQESDVEAAATFYDEVINFRIATTKAVQDAMENAYQANRPKQEGYTYGDAIIDQLKAYGSSAANVGMSAVKGVAKFGEAVGDFGTIAATGVATVFTGAYDLATGSDWGLTKEMWDNTKANVAMDVTSGLGDLIEDETHLRETMDKYAYDWFKSDGAACTIAEGAGYITGIVLLNAATFGGAGAATAATGTSGISSALGAGIWAGIGGTGKNTATAWDNGASIGEGLAYGAAKGAVEGFEMWLGYKINASQIFKGTGFKSAVGNALTHVAMDAADGGAGAVIDPALQLIYMTDEQKNAVLHSLNYDKDGNKINDITWDDLNAWGKYTANFNANGGWKNVGTQAASAAVVSFASEVPGVVRVGRASHLVNKISNEGLTEQTLDTLKKLKGKTLESFAEQAGTRMSLEKLKDVIPNIEKEAVVKIFDSALDTDDSVRMLGLLKQYDEANFKYLMENAQNLTSTTASAEFFKTVSDTYSQGAKEAMSTGHYNEFFKNFREHGIEHALAVTDYAKQIASQMGDVDIEKTVYSAFVHDLGMKGGMAYIDAKTLDKFYKANIDLINPDSVVRNSKGKVIKLEIDGKQFKEGDYIQIESWRPYADNLKNVGYGFLDGMARSNHPLNSALDVMTDGVSLPEGADKELTALIAMSHSKSTSGIRYMSSESQWLKSVDKLDAALKQYNLDNGTSYVLDTARLKSLITDHPKEFKGIVDAAFAVRDGDAMASIIIHDGGIYMQDGSISRPVVLESRNMNYDQEVLSLVDEAKTINDSIYNSNGEYVRELATPEELERYKKYVDMLANKEILTPEQNLDYLHIDSEMYSKMIHAGELNVKTNPPISSCIDGNYKATIELVDPNSTPNATFGSIKEKLGEINTYSNVNRTVEIILPKEAENKALGKWYQESLNELIGLNADGTLNETIKDSFLFDLENVKNNIGSEIYDAQIDFYKNGIKIVYK